MANTTSNLKIKIRPYHHPNDYKAVYYVWKSAGQGIHISPSDEEEEINKLVTKSPGLFFLAEIDKKVVGTVMGGFDGRRGFIYHLAVLPQFRNLRIGATLLSCVEDALRKAGCTKIYLYVVSENSELCEYYGKHGYEKMDVIPLTKKLR